MKRTTALLLTLSILASLVCGMVFADGDPGCASLSAAEEMLFGMYTKQSGDTLRDCYHKAVADTTAENTAALDAAVSGLKPLETYTRNPLIGFGDITASDIAAMKLINGTASQADGIITLEGSSPLRYSNADSEGIAGASPFGIATVTCDGFSFFIDSSSAAKADLSIGKRGTPEDCIFVIPDICVSEGKAYYFFPFECFGEDVPLDGTLNYISLTFTGTERVSFGDLHAVADSTETARPRKYGMEQISGAAFDAEDYYRIYQKDTRMALSYTTDKSRSNTEVFFAQEDPDDRAQEWQIVSVNALAGKRLVINRKYGVALAITASPMNLVATPAKLGDKSYAWTISYSKTKGFSFTVNNFGRLSYTNASARASMTSAAAKYYDIYRVPGENWNLAWSDEFNQDQVDRSVWTVMNAKNRGEYEPMYNRDSSENLYMEDGNLVIRSKVEEYKGYHATSAYLETQGKVQVTYGRVEMNARMPEGSNIWPAFWMMGDDEAWPNCGEIDVLEMVGGESLTYEGDTGVIGTLHYPNGDDTKAQLGGNECGTLYNSEKLSNDYHLYAFEWDSEYMRWYFDNILYFAEPIDLDPEKYTFVNNPMYMILDTSIRGPGGNRLPANLPDESFFYIDYIRYYKEDCAAVPEEREYEDPVNYSLYFSPYGLTRGGAAFSRENDIFTLINYSARCPVYNMKTGGLITTVSGPQGGWQLASALSKDGRYLAVAQEHGALSLVETGTGRSVWKQKYPFRTAIMDFSADGESLIAGTRSNTVDGEPYVKQMHVYSCENGTETAAYDIPGATSALKVSGHGNIAIGCCDGTVRLYSPEYVLLSEFKADDCITSLAFSPDGTTLYASTAKGRIAVLNGTAEPRVIVPVVYDEIYCMEVSPDGSTVAAAYGDGNIRLFDAQTGRLVNRICLGKFMLMSLSYSTDGKMIAATGGGGFAVIVSSDLSKVLASFRNRTKQWAIYKDITFNSDGTKIFTAGNTINFYCAGTAWDVPEGLVTEEEYADFSPLADADIYIDECKYTAKSYGNYYEALRNAEKVLHNRYSSQDGINSAAQALADAISALEEKSGVMKGDFDNDGQITVADALAALRIGAKLVDETPESVEIGDVDGDGHVTVADALAILRVAAKLADNL